jgi:YD repeat-containing protein
VGIVYPDGVEATAEYDANGNVVRLVDPRGTEIRLRYDAADRLVERRSRAAGSDADEVESLDYDAVGRLVLATTPAGGLRWAHDSLSRVLTEDFAGRTVRFDYDAAGRPTALDYPGGSGSDARSTSAVGSPQWRPQPAPRSRQSRTVPASRSTGSSSEGPRGRVRVRRDRAPRIGHVRPDRRWHDLRRLPVRVRRGEPHRLREIQLSDGIGERYEFDAANRPVRARYGIRDVLDPASALELETTYEYFPEGPWRRRRDLDGRGVVIADQLGTIDARNRYRQFGGTSFTYDAAGNTIRKGTDNPGFCLYTYDAHDRLAKSECFDANARRTQTIEYEHDALGRLVRKTVTDRAGNVTVIEFVWSGSTLLEEYENGVLVRTYVYSLGTSPARLTVDRGGRTDYWYVHNGRGLAAGLVRTTDPNAFAERYGYEIQGFPFVKEIDGLRVDLPQRVDTRRACGIRCSRAIPLAPSHATGRTARSPAPVVGISIR